jgi:hypothetical protein
MTSNIMQNGLRIACHHAFDDIISILVRHEMTNVNDVDEVNIFQNQVMFDQSLTHVFV